MKVTLPIVLLLIVATAWGSSQHPVVEVEAGRRLFLENCSACHGDTAKGGRGPDLTSGAWKHGGSDAEIVRNTMKGIPGTQMPAIPLSEGEAERIVKFLRSLATRRGDTEPTGNIETGRNLFFARAGCAECHMFGGRGGIQATDLTDLRSRGEADRITRQMERPIRMARVRLASGRMVEGLVKGEDTFSLRLIDQERRWHLLDKRAIRIREYTAPHPQLGQLKSGEAADLLAFLLRSEQKYEPDPVWRPAADLNVSFDRLKRAPAEPENWLTYWGDLQGRHYSGLKQITPSNIGRLRAAWTAQLGGTTVETTPLVVDGMMFVTGPLNNVTALDARTGQVIWKYTRRLPAVASHCTVMTNRGLAILGDRLYHATLDMHLIAFDAKSGNIIWDVVQDDYRKGISNTHAPLAIDGKIIVGVTAGECALTGFIDAFDAATG
ncbi:MAG: c-type cytochrome, partial [Acidobacteriota bacterium]